MLLLQLDCDNEVQLRKTKALLKEIDESVTKHSHQLAPYCAHIKSMLTNVLLKCKLVGTEETTPDISDFSNKQYVAPGKCSEHQWRFEKTSRTPGRKKNPSILR